VLPIYSAMIYRGLLLLFVALSSAHEAIMPINGALGVPGFPHCLRAHPEVNMTVDDAAMDLVCAPPPATSNALKIACVGDSITAGVHSSGGIHPYPQQLQILLDQKHGNDSYSVTNLGACGSTMLKKGDSPFWKRPQFAALTAGKWDIVTIMLGTNDAKDPGSHGPNNWQHDCGGPDHTTLEGCSFAEDFASMVKLVRTLGTTPAGPKIYALVPPPLMHQGAYGMNQTVINSVFPKLVPLIAAQNKVTLVDVYEGMGGVPDWEQKYPSSCSVDSALQPTCGFYCDKQSCDQCHPDDNGYTNLAKVLQAGLGL